MDINSSTSDADFGIQASQSPQLCGAYISAFGPIREQYLALGPGLNCLYGINGAGKSQILSCLVKTFENSTDLITRNSGLVDPIDLAGAALVYTFSSFGAYENPISRIWSENSMEIGNGLPNKEDVLAAHDYEGMARTSEYDQDRIENEPDFFEDHINLITRTIDSGRLVLIPRPDKKAYQIIYAISAACEDLEFTNFLSEFISKMKLAWASYVQAEDDPEEHFPQRIAELKGNPLVNAFNVQGHLTDQYVHSYAEHWNNENFNFPIQNFPFIPISSLGYVKQAPTSLITEGAIEDIEQLNKETRWLLRDFARTKLQQDLDDDEDSEMWWDDKHEVTDDEESEFMSRATTFSATLVTKIQGLVDSFLPVAPKLSYEIGDIDDWFMHRSPCWNVGQEYSQNFDNLSYAQQRWVRLALALGLNRVWSAENPSYRYQNHQILIIDEPEQGLHRVGESHLANGLLRYAEDTGIALVATHSPAFLNLPTAKVNLVSNFAISQLAPPEIEALEQLGLHPSDLLMTYRAFWLVEGQHEIAVFETLFGETLKNERIKLIPLRGVKSLASVVDSTLLFEYTNAKVVLTLDNLNGSVIQKAWATAVSEINKGRPINKVRDDLAQAVTSRSGEGRQLLEFMSSCLINQVQDRVTLTALSKRDIIEYFEPKDFGLPLSWHELREDFSKSPEFKAFKDFLIGKYSARISSSLLTELAAGLEKIPNDFQDCFEAAVMTALTANSS